MTKPSVAVIGSSNDRAKNGNKSVRAHLRAGYEVCPVNPKEAQIEGLKAYPSVLKIPVALDPSGGGLAPILACSIVNAGLSA